MFNVIHIKNLKVEYCLSSKPCWFILYLYFKPSYSILKLDGILKYIMFITLFKIKIYKRNL